MRPMSHSTLLQGLCAVGVAAVALASPASLAQHAVAEATAGQIWDTARQGDPAMLAEVFADVSNAGAAADARYLASIELYHTNIAKLAESRIEQLKLADERLDEHMAEYEADATNRVALSSALNAAVELQLLTDHDSVFFADARINKLIDLADASAKAAEAERSWLVANELYYRLAAMLADEGRYKDDVNRLGRRLVMIRLYAPERLWELRNERRIDAGEDSLPPYNDYGDDFRDKLDGINERMVYSALQNAYQRHVGRRTPDNPDGITLAALLDGGLDAVATMVTTTDLEHTFEHLADADARESMLGAIQRLRAKVAEPEATTGFPAMRSIVEALLNINAESVRVANTALLHEFGNGAMSKLDPYSAIIWPDELARFRRSTQGEFIGVGIQIQLDELMNIKIVTPLEGTPAQRAGIRANDIIKKVNGMNATGLSIDQAVEVITGPAGTKVTLTIERDVDDGEEGEKQLIDFKIARKRIDLPTVKGWSKTGPGDGDWDWFIDADAGVGYVRLTGFTEDTTRDFDRAVAAMKDRGLDSLILDLRYNPGGLLDQAVEISSRFVERGLIVKTVNAQGFTSEPQMARSMRPDKRLSSIPVVVLINEGSASASEIVSGAIQAAAHQGKIQAMVVGQRSFGKGSVQNVYTLSRGVAAMKLTTQYYRIDSPRMIHKIPGASEWGIDPDLKVTMLPDQQTEAILLRRDADVMPLDEDGNIIHDADRPDPDRLIAEGIDLQVQTALVILQAQQGNPLSLTALRDLTKPTEIGQP